MKTINLLPKKPFWEAWFMPMLGGLIAFYMIIGSLVWIGAWSADREHTDNLGNIAEMSREIQDLRNDRLPDPLLATFQQFQHLVTSVEQARKDWPPVVETLTRLLPESARIIHATYENKESTVLIDADFRSLNDAAEYVRTLRLAGPFEDVSIQSIATSALTLRDDQGEAILPPQHPPEVKLSSDDPQLQQLEWLIRRQALLQQYGIEIPVEHPDIETNKEIPELSEVFTEAELNAARSALEQFRSPLTFEVDSESVPVPQVLYYRVTLTGMLAQVDETTSERTPSNLERD